MSRCPSCFRPADVRSSGAGCGNGNCRATFPEGWHDSQVTCIAMAGARDTGKSIYIGALIPQLQQLVTQRGGVLRFATPEGEQLYNEHYRRQLYEQRAMMDPTPTLKVGSYQRTPIVLSIDPVGGPRHHVVIRDVAGEDLENRSPGVDLGFFPFADAVVFLFDPCHVPAVREKLRLRPAPGATSPQHVLDNVLRLIGNGRPRIAVTLSKFDALQELGEKEDAGWQEIMRNPGAAFVRDPSFAPTYDDGDGALLHEEVRSLLVRLDGQEIINRVAPLEDARPGGVRYFAVSALGAMPDGVHVHPQGIAPFRCVDPVRWVCAGSGAL